MYFEVALIAYSIDRVFGEFSFIRHPVVLMGEFISWFEDRFYKDSTNRGVLLTISLVTVVTGVLFLLQQLLGSGTFNLTKNVEPGVESLFAQIVMLLILGFIASTTIASKMLYESVKEIISHPEKIKYLVSRDTQELSQSDINKAAIETYAENLSDGVIAPLFYLLLFGLYLSLIHI